MEKKTFDNLNEIKLYNYTFKCPNDPINYIQANNRYGKNCILNPAKRGAKTMNYQNCQ